MELLGEMEVHTGSVKVIRRVSTGRVLSGTSDGSMILWDVDVRARTSLRCVEPAGTASR